MSHFDKVNKGMLNGSINCYMNVCLQSLLSCPAFFNMCTLVGANQETFSKDKYPILNKFAELSRYYDPNVLILAQDGEKGDWQQNEINKYNKTRVVDA